MRTDKAENNHFAPVKIYFGGSKWKGMPSGALKYDNREWPLVCVVIYNLPSFG